MASTTHELFKSVNHIDQLTLEVGCMIGGIWCIGSVGIRTAAEVHT